MISWAILLSSSGSKLHATRERSRGILLAVRKAGLYGDLVHGDGGARFHVPVRDAGLGRRSPRRHGRTARFFILPDLAVNPASDAVVTSPRSMAGHPMVSCSPEVTAYGPAAAAPRTPLRRERRHGYAWEGGGAEDPNMNRAHDGTAGISTFSTRAGYARCRWTMGRQHGRLSGRDPGFLGAPITTSARTAPSIPSPTSGNGHNLDATPAGEGAFCRCATIRQPTLAVDGSPRRRHCDWLSDPARLFDIDSKGRIRVRRLLARLVRHNCTPHELEIAAPA